MAELTERALSQMIERILLVFGLGLIVIAIVLGLIDVGDCGSAFKHSNDCDSSVFSGRWALIVTLIGLGITCFVAMVFVSPPITPEDAWDATRKSQD